MAKKEYKTLSKSHVKYDDGFEFVAIMVTISLLLLYKADVKNPPASTVRRFLQLLEQSDIDFSEELGNNLANMSSSCHFLL